VPATSFPIPSLLRKKEVLILIGALLGIGSGFLESSLLQNIADGFSKLFMNFLKLVSLPIIFLSIVSNLSGLGSLTEFKVLGRKVLNYALLTTFLAACVGLVFVLFIDPANTSLMKNQESTAASNLNLMDYLIQFIPDNFFKAFTTGNVIGIVVLSFALGLSILMLPLSQRESLHRAFDSLFSALLKMVEAVLYIMPFAVWAFIVLLMRDLDQDLDNIQPPLHIGPDIQVKLQLTDIALYLFCVVGANLVQAFLILPVFLKLKGIAPFQTAKAVFPALSLAFFSKSSSASLPTTLRCAEQNLGLSKRVTFFSLPLCSTINMNGCAAFILVTVLFVTGSQGVLFTPIELAGLTLLSIIGAFGNAAVPMGCFFVASAFLAIMGMPLHIMGLIVPVYALIDMLETAINVWSDVCITAVVDRDIHKEG
tara:strand:+ start:2702 stop:3973 length:1272 start_codon:yes stop_codon:yes gene_type:complete